VERESRRRVGAAAGCRCWMHVVADARLVVEPSCGQPTATRECRPPRSEATTRARCPCTSRSRRPRSRSRRRSRRASPSSPSPPGPAPSASSIAACSASRRAWSARSGGGPSQLHESLGKEGRLRRAQHAGNGGHRARVFWDFTLRRDPCGAEPSTHNRARGASLQSPCPVRRAARLPSLHLSAQTSDLSALTPPGPVVLACAAVSRRVSFSVTCFACSKFRSADTSHLINKCPSRPQRHPLTSLKHGHVKIA
jgi:hypothetical protein